MPCKRSECGGKTNYDRDISSRFAVGRIHSRIHQKLSRFPLPLTRARRVSDKLRHAELADFDCRQKLVPIGHAVRALIVVAFVSANCSSRLRSHDPIDGSMVVPSASESALHLRNCVSIAISGIVVPVVIVRVVPVIRIRIEERETKRVDKHEPVETVEATKSIIPIEVAPAPTLKAGGGV